MTQLIDFSPLSRIGDTYLKALEAQRDREEGAALVAQMERMGGGAPAASSGASSGTPAAPAGGRPSFAGGDQRMRMPADPELERTALETAKGMGLTNPFGLA